MKAAKNRSVLMGGAILTVILLIITVGYVRASVRQGALT